MDFQQIRNQNINEDIIDAPDGLFKHWKLRKNKLH